DSPDARVSSSFEQIAAEEPPMPTLEESGTVGDLMLGVGDPSFQHVLAMMRGEEVEPEEDRTPPSPALPVDVEEAFESFFESQVESAPERKPKKQVEPPPAPPPEREEFNFEP